MIPLLIVAIGRSGSTLSMRVLASHPEIVAHEQYPLEFRPYQLSLFGKNQKFPEAGIFQQQYRFRNDDQLLYSTLQSTGAISTARALSVYESLAADAGKMASYFAEKSGPRRDFDLIAAANPATRLIVLTRDPRDVLVSARSFSRKQGLLFGFEETPEDTDESLVTKYLDLYDRLLLQTSGKLDCLHLKYEDMIERPIQTIRDVFKWLGLIHDDNLVQAAVDRAHSIEDGRHVTSTSLQGSVGRWRLELPERSRQLYRDRFGHILERLGYPVQ